MRHDNSHHLLAAAQRRRADTLERARKALHELGETGQRRTLTQIAAHAGVSRSWLYAQPELRDQLRGLTAISETAESTAARIERGSDASLPRSRRSRARHRQHGQAGGSRRQCQPAGKDNGDNDLGCNAHIRHPTRTRPHCSTSAEHSRPRSG
jgi:Family of unknown function (DUF6262)